MTLDKEIPTDATEGYKHSMSIFDDVDVTPVKLTLHDAAPRDKVPEVEISIDGENGTQVMLIQANRTGALAREWLIGNEPIWRQGLIMNGAVLLRGFDVSSAVTLDGAANVVFSAPYSTAEHPRQMVEGRVVTPVEYPSDLDLFWHNEDSFNQIWPALISFACSKVPNSGGQTTFVDGNQVLSAFAPIVRQKFEKVGVSYVRRFHPGLGRPWQSVFRTEDPVEVVRICKERGEEATWEDGVLCTRVTRPAIYTEGGIAFWIAQILHWHEYCLPEDIRSELEIALGGKLPRECAFGDGEPIPNEVVQDLINRSREIEYALDWRGGDVIFVDNRRLAHGRRAYIGDRGVLVSLGDPIQHQSTSVTPNL